jgi:TM2 domain-containing membrane protein YozV
MEQNQVAQLIALYGGKFPAYSLMNLSSTLSQMDNTTASVILSQTKDPIIVLVLSILVGGFGIDRIYIGDTTLGVLKLITCGGLGIWTIIDWFLIMEATKEKNLYMLNIAK